MPGFGSCWGMQVMSVAPGGRVHLHPDGPEVGIARGIRLTGAGRAHPVYAGKHAAFDALCWHHDEVCTIPPGAVILAENDHSAVQALAVEDGTRSFWGVQYHPEFDLHHVAAIIEARAASLAEQGLVLHGDDARALARDLRALQTNPARKDVVWRNGITLDLTQPDRHRAELANWLRVKVLPRASA